MRQRVLSVTALALASLALLGVVVPEVAARYNSVYDQLDLLVDVRHELVDSYVEAPDEEKLVEQAVRGMVSSLNDPYTQYLNEEDLKPFEENVRGQFSGIGAEVDIDPDTNRLRIVSPLEDSPAWNAGVMAGDVVLAIDDTDTEGMTLPEAVKKLLGEPNTKVTIRVRHEAGEEATLTITRGVIKVQTVRGFRRGTDGHYDFLMDTDPKVGYIRITQFGERTAEEFREALTQLKGQDIQALILDVRFNPGGLLESVVEISDMLLPANETIVSVKGRKVPEQIYSTTGKALMPDVPIVILANEASASAAEILTGALSDNNRALFVGARTFGKGSVQQVRQLPGGHGAIKMTNAYYYLPNGRNIHRREGKDTWGVDPTEGNYVALTPDEVKEMIDARREGDTLRRISGDEATRPDVTPAWVREHLKDPQLAAAVEAVDGKLDGGSWPEVGKSNVEELLKQQKRLTLMKRRDLLQEAMGKLNQEIEDLDKTVDAASAQGVIQTSDLPATDPERVEERVKEVEAPMLAPVDDPLSEPVQDEAGE